MVNKRLFFITSLCVLLNFSNACNANTSALTQQIKELTKTIKSLSAKITLLEKQLPNVTPTAVRFYKIRSLSDFGSWSWNNKGNIALTGCGLTLVYVVCSASQEARKTRALLMQAFDKIKRYFEQARRDRQVMNANIIRIGNHLNLQGLQPLENAEQHTLDNPDDSWLAKAWKGMRNFGSYTKSGIGAAWKLIS